MAFILNMLERQALICSLVHDARRNDEAESRPDYSSLLKGIDEHRVIFHLTKRSFKVTLAPKLGRMENKYFPVKTGEDAISCLALARMYWNQFDTSSSERYASKVL